MNKNKTCHAFSTDILQDFDGVELAKLLKSKEISPHEVVEASIKRAQSVDPTINAVEHNCYLEAIKRSDKPLGPGFFAGVPSFIKDNTPVIGMPTNHGSATINSQPNTENGPYANQYLAQGFALLGKSVLPEFGFNATTEPNHRPATKNPWNTDYSTGASSGGAAALVAAGVVPIAHANDGGGSIRIPAACCGLVGLKPTRNRHVNGDQARSLPINIVSEGIVSRTVRDTARFHAEAEKYYKNKKLQPIGLVEGSGKKRLRIGLVIDSITGYPTDNETRHTMSKTADLLTSMGHHVEEMTLPVNPSFIEDFSLYWSMLAFLTQKTGRFSMDPSFDASQMDGLSLGLIDMYKKKFYKTPLFLYRLRKTYQQYANVFATYDAVLTPVLAHTPAKLGHISPTVPFDTLFERLMRYVSFTPLANTSGAPAISLPMGETDNNVPISIQLSANHGEERTLLELAYELEEAQPWRKIHQLKLAH
ncbi:amidase [Gammaproteobacteria bacterium 45_16_T64]|nr:amidase [Gammaproteobacteria bacterium 45_16_T64]